MKKFIISILSKIKFILDRKVKLSISVLTNFSTRCENNTKIYFKSDIRNTEIGRATYLGWHTNYHNSKIGSFCSIAPYSEVVFGRHPAREYISTHPCFFSTYKQANFTFADHEYYEQNKLIEGKSIIIGNDVWIGWKVMLLEGLTIGDGAIIAAGSVVTKDVAPFEIVGGNPAKHISYRFSKEIIDKILKDPWWTWDWNLIKENFLDFHYPDKFIKKYYGETETQ